MNTKIFYNQGEMGGGGGVSASPAPSPQGGAVAAPSAPASGGAPSTSNTPDTAYQRFQQQLSNVAKDTAKPSQPGSDAKTSDELADPSQGDENGDKTEDDQGTTADDAGDSTDTEGKGANENEWSPDELKGMKAHGIDDMPFHPSTRKLVESNRELRTKFDQVSASNANAITEAETIRQAAYAAANGDVQALQKALGVDMKLNTRTPDDMIAEIQGYHGEHMKILQDTISAYEGAGQMEVAQALLDVGNKLLGTWNQRANVITEEKKWQERERDWMSKAGKATDPQEAYKGLSNKAKENLAAITAEDPEAVKYYTEIEKITGPGGPMRALGIDLARAFGTNLQTAKHFIEMGKALHIKENQNKILNDSRKKWEADYERKKALGGTRGNTSGGSAGGKQPDAAMTNLAGQMRAFMGRQ